MSNNCLDNTYEENREEHRKLWQWLADNPDKEKIEYFDEFVFPEYFKEEFNCCFACFESRDTDGDICCDMCPITWISDGHYNYSCEVICSPYFEWRCTEIMAERTLLALIIKDLWPEKDMRNK